MKIEDLANKTYDELSPEEKAFADQEHAKCIADPVYFTENYWLKRPMSEREKAEMRWNIKVQEYMNIVGAVRLVPITGRRTTKYMVELSDGSVHYLPNFLQPTGKPPQ
mgnify:CR=1 FL=1